MEEQTHFAPIPQPKPDPLLKNLKDLDSKNPVQGRTSSRYVADVFA